MATKSAADAARRARLISELQAECSERAVERVERYLRVQHHGIVAATPFAAASAECIDLFRDGHYYGAISLSQAVGEALVRHMCLSNEFRPGKAFEQNVQKLKRRSFIDAATATRLLLLWENRNDYHHLNNGIVTDRASLERLAFTKVRALAET